MRVDRFTATSEAVAQADVFRDENSAHESSRGFWRYPRTFHVRQCLMNPSSFCIHRSIRSVHSRSLVAGLSNGGLLCAGPDGVRVFNVNGDPVLRLDRQQHMHGLRSHAPALATGSWEARPLAKLITIVGRDWLEAGSLHQTHMDGKTSGRRSWD